MKWKEYNRGSSSNEPVKFKDVSEIVPDRDGFGSLGSNAAFLIDEYVGDIARRWYSNGRIPENEERAITDALIAVYVEFDYWMPKDEEYEAGYEEGKAMFIIDKNDGSLCNMDVCGDYPDEAVERAKKEAYKYLGVKPGENCCPD